MMKLTQFKKIGSISKISIPLGNLKIESTFETSQSRFYDFTLLLFDSWVCLLFNKENDLNLKRNQKLNREISDLNLNKI